MIKLSSRPCRTGLLIGGFILSSIAPLMSEGEPIWVPKLEDSQVFVTYGELKRLTDQAASAQKLPPPPPAPAVPACLSQTRYQVTCNKLIPQLTATFVAENLSSGWTSIGLGSFNAATSEALPPSVRLARADGQTLLLLEKPGRTELTLKLAPSSDGTFEIDPPEGSALSSLELATPPADHTFHLTGADGMSTRYDQAAVISLRPGASPLRLALVSKDDTSPQGLAHENAIITEASFQTQMAQDGAQLTSVRLRLEHSAATILPVNLPTGAEMLRCAILDAPVPTHNTAAGTHLVVPAPTSRADSSKGTEITFSYFLQGSALKTAEGEQDLSLPRFALLIRRLDWTVEFPDGLQLTAQGNLELQASPAPQGHVLQLTRRLCRDSTTQARITYRQPNLNVR
jgi:hypothetical protein